MNAVWHPPCSTILPTGVDLIRGGDVPRREVILISSQASKAPAVLGCTARGTDCESVLREMAGYLARQGLVKESYCQAVLDREAVYPTGIPADPVAVAIPHSDREHVLETAVLVARTEQPVLFHRIDDPDDTVEVRVVFMMAIDSSQGQLDTITQVMGLIQDPGVIGALAASTDPEEIRSIAAKAFAASP